jgi:hypothetical protein
MVDVGNERKPCNTTRTAAQDGYPEATFTLDLARRRRQVLRAEGATVVFTHDGDSLGSVPHRSGRRRQPGPFGRGHRPARGQRATLRADSM